MSIPTRTHSLQGTMSKITYHKVAPHPWMGSNLLGLTGAQIGVRPTFVLYGSGEQSTYFESE